METIAVSEAKSRLSEILAAVELGQEFTVTKRGAPIARIIPYHHTPMMKRHYGRAKSASPIASGRGMLPR